MVNNTTYTPDKGDIVWLTFNPQSGHEQSGRRPVVTLSPKAYNKKVGLTLFCPITTCKKNYPFEVDIPEECSVDGVILSDQIRSLDFRSRNAEFISTLPLDSIQEVQNNIMMLIQ